MRPVISGKLRLDVLYLYNLPNEIESNKIYLAKTFSDSSVACVDVILPWQREYNTPSTPIDCAHRLSF